MEQRFVSFEEALEKLGISSDRLNELRDHGQLRAYRDGSSWKFRSDEIESMVKDGVPDIPPPSDIGLVDSEELVAAEPIEVSDEDDKELELESLGEAELPDSELELDLEDTDALSLESELDLTGMEDTVAAGTSSLELDLSDDEPGDPSDSILLSEEELGESVGTSPSTIIGKGELASEEADLGLTTDDPIDAGSDVNLAAGGGASDVLSSGIAGSGVLDELTEGSDGLSAFEGLEELEIDLSAESSRILSPEDVEAAKMVSEPEAAGTADSDLTLDDDSQLADDADLGSTDVPLEELEPVVDAIGEEGSGSELELAGDEDLLLDDPSGSDITLDSGDSGINLVSPSDSGLALDNIPLDMGGSAILSSLSLEGSDPEISLIGNEPSDASPSEAALQTDDDFQLTPMSEGVAESDVDSSSQVIALDADIEELGQAEVSGLGEVEFGEAEAGVMLTEDFAEAPAGEVEIGYSEMSMGQPVAIPDAEQPYTVWNVVLLSACGTLLLLAGTMGIDLVRNMWGWNENLTINSSLMDAIRSIMP